MTRRQVRAYRSLVALRAMRPEHFAKGFPCEEAGAALDRIASGPAASQWRDVCSDTHGAILVAMTKGKTGLLQLGGRVAAYVPLLISGNSDAFVNTMCRHARVALKCQSYHLHSSCATSTLNECEMPRCPN